MSTSLDQKLVRRSHVKAIFSGDTVELFEYEKPYFYNWPPQRRAGSATPNTGRLVKTERRADNVRVAQQKIRRLINANASAWGQVPKFVTYTFRENVQDLKDANELWTLYQQRLRRRFHGLKYLAVVEFQKRGAVHWHVLIWGLNEYARSERVTRSFSRLWQRGFVDCIITNGHPKIASYLAKYMSKSMSDIRLGGKRAYYTSHNILRSVSVSSSNSSIQAVHDHDVIPPVDNLLTTHEFDTHWLGRAIYQSYRLGHYAHQRDSAYDPKDL